jgi:hypothetical protein
MNKCVCGVSVKAPAEFCSMSHTWCKTHSDMFVLCLPKHPNGVVGSHEYSAS